MDPLRPTDPSTIGRYRLVGRLGAGGMGLVYLGVTPEGQHAAVKVIRDELAGDTAFRARFRREVSAAVSVAGIFTARVLDADPEGEPPWLATQFVQGESLRATVDRAGPLPLDQLIPLAQGLCDALGSIHAAGLVHRDLKPGNILLSPTGARVIDFGIARMSSSATVTATGEVLGTPEFMSPEQVAGAPVTPSADVFSFGSTLVWAATGHSPFATDHTAATLYRIMQTDPDLGATPEPIAELARACLRKTPADRPTLQQIASWLRRSPDDVQHNRTTLPGNEEVTRPIRGGRVPLHVSGAETLVPAALHDAPERPAPARRRRWLWPLAALLVLAVAGTTLALVLTRGGQPATAAPDTTTPVATPVAAVDPNDPRVRYLDRLCRSGKLLVSLGDSTPPLTVTDDPAMAKRDFLAAVDRYVGTMDVALADFGPLRDEAPTSEVRIAFAQMITEFEQGRASFTQARATVAAVEPMTVVAYQTGVNQFLDGTRNVVFAATLQEGITLPAEYTDLTPSVPSCND